MKRPYDGGNQWCSEISALKPRVVQEAVKNKAMENRPILAINGC
jgi:hypothetical protein